VYDAAGQKLSVTYQTAVAGVVIPMTNVMKPLTNAQISQTFKTDYCGNVIYENGAVSRILTEEGYITFSGTTPIYHYYLKDHQGNNRVVLNQDGTVEQVNHYYPFGGLMGESTAGGVQPYKYNGKELDRMHGLDLFDYGARHYDAAIGRWMSIDPLAEKYYSISTYAYVANNPVNYVDLRGDSITTIVNATITNPDGTTSLQSTRYHYGQNSSGAYGFIDGSGNLYSGTDVFVKSLTTALDDLRTGGNVGSALVSELASSTKNVQIVQGKNTADPNGTYIKWNPNSTTGGINQIGTEYRPAFIGLGHEMAHIQDIWKGTIDNNIWVNVGGTAIPNAEKYATHIENQLRAENNISLRTHYGIDAISGRRVGLESTRIINGNLSLFYNQSNGKSPIGISLLSTPFIYRKK
jgi:RHS repeat-associated protein